ncbi:HlyD family type I secretion periplasmic adaptor subunit [Pseudorhodoplanes sinuspersici]|uniref:Membrane fusion protein (MFP) family protein n=1 Tax=Pseudorhodoplanes sinuspersici TaxID=1235591 RepID=A0A1W6ZPL5_9HYPH|nr:HlyD family type I secretion periplasmic adaptor subunit [Pseudorhodoplanes sinuspersici]ARP99348.1 hemolysin secretion protein D [Pseudorhodoplanes sinuspersici]RKE70279.1 HlyD family secretion protein [Pseudorhodoplanes sinuspersici]
MSTPSTAQPSIRRHILAGAVVVGVLVIGFGGWAGTTQLSGALIAPGQIVVDSNVKKVQHPTGGIVGEVRVQDGDRVKSGDIVVRLDETVTGANLAIVTRGLNELRARKARLEAERDGVTEMSFPKSLTEVANDPDVRAIIDGERKLFELRRTSRAGQKSQLQQRINQLQEEITGHTAQRNAKAKEVELIERELAGVRDLYSKNLIQLNRLTQLEREATRLEGERGLLVATTAQAKGKINELELQIIQIDQELSSEVAKEMRDVDARIGEFVERKVTAEDQLRRIDIRAPQDGTVFQSTVHTVGGVISAGDAIMLIVPNADNLTVEAKVNPQDINQLQLGQKAVLRFTAFNQQSTPEIDGTVSRISADIAIDQRTGLGYYTIRIALPAAEVARLGDVKLVPGMPVEAFVQTGDRTVMSYLMKPLSDHFNRAFREK